MWDQYREIPKKAKDAYDDAVRILQEDLAQRRALRATDVVIDNLLQAVEWHDEFFEAWRLLGEIYLGTEQPLKGYIALKKAYRLKEGDVGVATLLGEASLTLDRPALALEYLKEAHEGEQIPLAARKLLALALAKSEKWEESLRAFGEALAEDPSDGEMRMECARVLGELGYPQDAASVLADYLDPYRDVIDKTPAILESGWIMQPGAVLDRLSPGAKKRAAAKETVARPENYLAWHAMGNQFLDGEEYEAAVACYKRALRIHPDYYDSLHNMGIALEELGREDDAFQMYESAIEADPDSAEAYLSVAELLEDMSPEDVDEIALNYLMYFRLDPEAEGFEEFEAEISKRLQQSPDIAQTLLLAHVYLLRDEIDKADRILRLIESAGGGETTINWVRGRIHSEQGNLEEAEKSYRRGLDVVHEEGSEAPLEEENLRAKLTYDLASLLEEDDREEEAREILEGGIDILDADGLSLLAELLVETDPEGAEEMWRRALNLDPEHPDTLLGLAERMIESGRVEEGLVLLETARKGDPEDKRIADRLNELYPKIGADELCRPVTE